MRQIVREKREVKTFEMVPFSAREFLLKKELCSRADQLEGDGLVEMVQIGPFIDLSPGPHIENISLLSAFKIWPMQNTLEGLIRMTGCAFSSKEDLKKFLKKFRAYSDTSHMASGLSLGCWRIVDGQFVWLSAGLKKMRALIDIVRDSLFSGALEVAFPDLESAIFLRKALNKEAGASVLAEIYEAPKFPWDPDVGLLGGDGGAQIRVSCFAFSKEYEAKLISFLQMTSKTLNILGFRYRLSLLGRKRSDREVQAFFEALPGQEVEMRLDREVRAPRLEFLVEDNLGRNWPAFSVEKIAEGFVIKASVERLLALLLEKSTCGSNLGEKLINGEQH